MTIVAKTDIFYQTKIRCIKKGLWHDHDLTCSDVITHDVTTGTGYCLVGFNWIIDFLN